MTRLRPLLLVGALLLAAAPVGKLAAAPPSPPSPLATPAPMPDLDLTQPPGPDSGPARPSLMPGLSRPGYGTTADSQGYTAGSTYSEAFDGRFRVMPTLRLSVPLQ